MSSYLARENLKDTLTKIQRLLAWKAGWNGYDALAPDAKAIEHAEAWIVKLFGAVEDLGLVWIKPNVTADADGEVVFEWWYGTKKLTVYVSDETVEYVKVWGPSIDSEMLDGDAKDIDVCESLWL